MQPWTGGRRRERSSSVVLLKGKLSAIVRRGSIFQAEPEDGRGSGSGYSKEEGEEPDDSSDGRLSAVSAMTMWDPNASRNAQRFQFYPTRTLVAAALARPLGEEEVARRVALEAEMDSFEAMHMSFAPREVADKQEDEDDELDNNEMETLEEQERRAALEDDEEDASGEDESEGFAADEECLDFDEQNLGESVRTLVSRIRSQSLMGGSEVHVGSTTGSNQDDDEDEDDDDDDDDDEDDDNENDEDDEEHDYDGEVNCVEDVEDLDLDNNNGAHYKHYKHFEEDEQELEEDSKPTTSRLSERRRTLLLSCAAEQAALTAQDQLTSSVRRLVIELKDDSDRVGKPLAHSHGIRRKSLGAPPERKRAGSCPMPYDMSSGDMSTQGGEMSMPPPPPLSPPLAADDMYSDKKLHKKSAFSRIGPRVLKTLHLRKKRKTYLFTDQELETIEGARWKIVELAFRFGGKHRAYLVQAINMFFPLLKYGRRGGGHATRLHCNLCGTLQWQHKRGGLSEAVDLAGVLQVLEGRQTAVFLKYPSSSTLEECSFSVVFLGRTLDLETQSPSHRDWLVSALRTLVSYARRQRRIEQQAIAERTILPLDDDVPLVNSHARTVSSRTAHRRREDSTKMQHSPNYKIRTVY